VTHLDHHRPPTRSARRAAHATRRTQRAKLSGRSDLSRTDNPGRSAGYGRVQRPGKPNWSRSAIGAAVVGGAAMAAAFAFILSNGTSAPPADDSGAAVTSRDVTTTSAAPSADPAPSVSTPKAARTPPVSRKASPPAPNTGPTAPKFRAGQWIAVLDSYPTDTGMAADQAARDLAVRLIKAGVPAKAMLASGQYPGLAGGDLQPITGTWVVITTDAINDTDVVTALADVQRIVLDANDDRAAISAKLIQADGIVSMLPIDERPGALGLPTGLLLTVNLINALHGYQPIEIVAPPEL
jgi:hypothetical protein